MPKPRRIIIVGSAYPLRGGGIATFNERLAKAFLDHGDHVMIYNFKLQYPGFLFPGKTQYSDEEAPEDLVILTKINSVNPFNWFRIGKEIRALRPDVVIMRYWLPFMAPCLGTIAKNIRKNDYSRIIAITDNVIPHEKRPGDKLLTRYFLKQMHGYIAMSASVLRNLSLFNKDRPRELCPHPLYDNFGDPVDKATAISKLGLDPAFRYILFFGFIRDYKGLDLLIRAFADERLRRFPLKLLIAGEFYSDPAPYYRMVSELGLDDKVIMKNEFIPNSGVVDYFCASDLVVQPYKHATQSGVTQVAYHFEKPMVVTNVGALPEMVAHGTAGYVTTVDDREIASSILDYFENEREAKYVSNLHEEKKKFSWENMIRAVDSLIQQVP